MIGSTGSTSYLILNNVFFATIKGSEKMPRIHIFKSSNLRGIMISLILMNESNVP